MSIPQFLGLSLTFLALVALAAWLVEWWCTSPEDAPRGRRERAE